MDEAVLAAIARWPDVPQVHGWLSLDRRGKWRLQGSPIDNPRITNFIGRNYASEAGGAWFFQNGPQRVFVRLDYTPWVLRIGQDNTLYTHTGLPLLQASAAMLDESGNLLIAFEGGIGLVEDRDLSALLACIVDADGQASEEEALTRLIDGQPSPLWLDWRGTRLPIALIQSGAVAKRFGFVANPEAV